MEASVAIKIQSQITSDNGTEISKPNHLPPIFVARRVIEKMCAGALIYQGEETGEALVGLEMPNGHKLPRVFLLDTLPPVEGTVREWAMFEQGDDWQGAIFNWWHENWEMYRQMRRNSYGNALAAKWDAPLQHVGDWHKQPAGLIKPSRGDFQTARRLMRELKRDYMIAPIITLAHETEAEQESNTLLVELETEGVTIRIDFWWIAKRAQDFEPLKPVVLSNEDLPRLPPVVWWLEQPERSDSEIAALKADGLELLDMVSWDIRGHPPLDTCLVIYRPGSRNVLIAITPVNYPRRPPLWRVAPIMRPEENVDFFEMLYKASSEVSEDLLPEWTAESTLLDAVKAIEAKGNS